MRTAASALLGAAALFLVAALPKRAAASVPIGGNSWAPLDWPALLSDLPEVAASINVPEWSFAGDPDFWDDYMPDAESNLRAFLFAIRVAEGTADSNGYRALFGHRRDAPRLFDSFADHPRIATQFTDKAGRRLWTTAAGAYQFVAISPLPGGGFTKVDTWDRLQRKLGLPDFSPASQDAAAIELIGEQGALDDVRAGRLADAVRKVRSQWASLPGAGYDQPERTLGEVQAAYINAGGSLA